MNKLHALMTFSLYFHYLAVAVSLNQPPAAPSEQEEATEGSLQKRYQHHGGRQNLGAQRAPQEMPAHHAAQASNQNSSAFQNPGLPRIQAIGNRTSPRSNTSEGNGSDYTLSGQSSVVSHDSARTNELLPTFVLYDYNSEPCSRRPIVQCSHIPPVSNIL